jgi:AsmA protein
MKKRILLASGIAVAVVVLAALILYLVVDVESFRGFVETRAEDALGRDVRLGELRLSIVPVLGVQVDDVAIAARPEEGEGDLLTLRSLRIGARLRPLLAKRLEVTSVVLMEPEISLTRDSNGEWNFDLGAGGETSKEGGPSPELTIDSLRVMGGRISVRDESGRAGRPLEVVLAELDLELSGFGGDDVSLAIDRGRLAVTRPTMSLSPVEVELGDTALYVRDGGAAIELKTCRLSIHDTAFNFKGTVTERPDGRQVDLDLAPTRIALADLSSFLDDVSGGLGVSVTGKEPVNLEAGVHGLLAEGRLPEVTATVGLSGVTVAAPTLSEPVTDISGVARISGGKVDVEGLEARVGDSDFAGSLQLEVAEGPIIGFALESDRADLDQLLALMTAGQETGEPETASPVEGSFLMSGVADGSLKVAEGTWANLRFRKLDARLRLADGVVTLEPVTMELYDGSFRGRLVSDLTQVPQAFEFTGEVNGVDVEGFLADQMDSKGILLGRFTGRVSGSGAGAEPQVVISSLKAEGAAQILDGQVGSLDIIGSIGQVAGVLGQRSLANLTSGAAGGATSFSHLGGDFRIADGRLLFDTVLLASPAFDLTGTGNVNLLTSIIDGEFQVEFSEEVSAWMKQEGSRAAEVFLDPQSGRVVLPLALSGRLDDAGATVDWGAAAKGFARRTAERELGDLLGDLLGGSGDDETDQTSTGGSDASQDAAPDKRSPDHARRAESGTGTFAVEVTRTEWGGSFLAQDYKVWGTVRGAGVDRVVMTAADAGGREIEERTVDVAERMSAVGEASFEVRVDGKRLLLVDYPVTVSIAAVGEDGESAAVTLEIAEAGR